MYVLIFLLYSLTFAANGDRGLGIDPNGGRATAYSDEGPGLCPVGRMKSGTNLRADQGPAIDPNG